MRWSPSEVPTARFPRSLSGLHNGLKVYRPAHVGDRTGIDPVETPEEAVEGLLRRHAVDCSWGGDASSSVGSDRGTRRPGDRRLRRRSATTRSRPQPAHDPQAQTATNPPIAIEPDSPVAGVELIASTLQLDLQKLGHDSGPIDADFSSAHACGSQALPGTHQGRWSGARGARPLDCGRPLESPPGSHRRGRRAPVGADRRRSVQLRDQRPVRRRHLSRPSRPCSPRRGSASTASMDLRPRPHSPAFTPAGVPEPVKDVGVTTTSHPATTTEPRPPDELLKVGSTGARVKQLQERLASLGYRPGPADGTYGAATASAVLAFQKREGLKQRRRRRRLGGIRVVRTLTVLDPPPPRGPDAADRHRYRPAVGVRRLQRRLGDHAQLLHRQRRDLQRPRRRLRRRLHARRKLHRDPQGSRDEHAPLGTLRNPLYFYKGWAIHGAANVPAYPASHGCARISNPDADWLFPQIALGTPVIVYDTTGRSPSREERPGERGAGLLRFSAPRVGPRPTPVPKNGRRRS